MINICANTNFFLEIILHITHVLLVWPALRRGGKGSDLMNGHRVFPGKGGHGFTVPPALALSVCLCACACACVSFNMSQLPGRAPHQTLPETWTHGVQRIPPIFSYTEMNLCSKSTKKMFTCQVWPLLTTPMIYPHCSHVKNVRTLERAGPCLPPTPPLTTPTCQIPGSSIWHPQFIFFNRKTADLNLSPPSISAHVHTHRPATHTRKHTNLQRFP